MGERRENDFLQKDLTFCRHHEAVTATSTIIIFKARTACRVSRVEYANTVGLTADAANAFKGEIKNGATVLATLFQTESDQPGGATLLTTTVVSEVGGTPALANVNLAAGDVLTLVLTEAGTQTLPPGDVTVYATDL